MALKEVLALFSFQVEGQEKLKTADTSVKGLQSSIGGLGKALGAVGGVVAVKGLFDWVNGVADAADATDKFASAIGSSARDVAEWDQILGDAGVGLEKGRLGMKTFAKQAGEAARGSKELQAVFGQLGVRTRDTSGKIRPLNDRMTDAVIGLERIADPARKAAAAEKLFGEAGLGFIRVAQGGAESLAAQRKEFDELHGGGSYEQFIEDSKAAAVANDRWRNASKALQITIASALVPVLTRVIDAISATIRGMIKLVRGTKIVQTTVALLGGVLAAFAVKLAIAFAPALLTIGAFVAVIGVAILLIEDIYQLFTGGESLIGRWIDSMLGAGESERVVEAIKEAVSDLIDAFKDLGSTVGPIFDTLLGYLRKALAIIGKVTGALSAGVEKLAEFGAALGTRLGERERERQERQAVREADERSNRELEGLRALGKGGRQGLVIDPELARSAREARARGQALTPQQQAIQTLTGPGGRYIDPTALPGITELSPTTLLRAAAARANIQIAAPTQITIQGTADPAETARLVVEQIDAREQETLQRARDLAVER